jgi:hypothetical protein
MRKRKTENLVEKEIVMFSLMKTSYAALITDFNDEKKKNKMDSRND